MPHRIELSYTGDFCIDQGLAALWSILTSGQRTSTKAQSLVTKLAKPELYKAGHKQFGTVTLTSDRLILEFKNKTKLEAELSKLTKKLKSNYLRKSSTGRLWWYGLSRFFYSQITSGIDSFFLTPLQILSSQRSKWARGSCDFCGSTDRYVKVAGATENPLLVIAGKFSSFYSHLKGEIKICNWCSFASKFAPLQMFYSINRGILVALCLECDNFLSLVKVQKEFSRLFAEAEDYRNFPRVLYRAQYALETFVDFLFATKQEIEKKKSDIGEDLIEEGMINRVHVLRAALRQGLMIDRYYVIPNLPSIFRFVTYCDWKSKEGKKHNALVKTTNMLVERKGTDYDTTLREEFSRRLLHKKDTSEVLERYLIDNSQRTTEKFSFFDAINTAIFIKMYMLNQMRMDSHLLAVAKGIGEMIGDITSDSGNRSLLYSLRSIGNLNSLLDYLKELFIRYVDNIKPDRRNVESLLHEIDNSNWQTYKSLIGIYAVLRFVELEGRVARPIAHRR